MTAMQARLVIWPSLLVFVGAIALFAWQYWTAFEISEASDRSSLIAAIWHHVGVSTVMIPVSLAYIVWRWRALGPGSWPIRMSGAVATGALIFLVVTGPFVVWTYGSDLKIFDWVSIPNPTGKMPTLHDWLEPAHARIADLALFIVPLDAGLRLFSAFRRI